jgi:hypothetical protein
MDVFAPILFDFNHTLYLDYPGGAKILETDTLWEYRLKGLPFWNSFSPQRSLQVMKR